MRGGKTVAERKKRKKVLFFGIQNKNDYLCRIIFCVHRCRPSSCRKVWGRFLFAAAPWAGGSVLLGAETEAAVR